jgi:DNA repair protein RadA/Sms
MSHRPIRGSFFACLVCNHMTDTYSPACPSCASPNTLKRQVQSSNAGVAPMRARTVKLARTKVGLESIDQALGGGLVPGSAILLSGTPGVGKSTLALFLTAALGEGALYVTSEETREQVEDRMTRTALSAQGTPLLCTREPAEVLRVMNDYSFIVVDSLHKLLGNAEDVANRLVDRVKESGNSLLCVAHLTKAGTVRGPSTVEYVFDANLELVRPEEGQPLRELITLKNRFGPEGSWRMLLTSRGWEETEDPATLSGMLEQ